RQSDKRGQLWQFAADLLHDLLDQKAAERHAGKSALAIRNRIEHRDTRLVELDELPPTTGKDRRDGTWKVALNGNFDENQGIVDQRRVEERKAATVRRIDAASQIVPTPDLVHGLVADDLFQHDCGSRPVDTTQDQEAAIKPRREQVDEICVDDGKVLLPAI